MALSGNQVVGTGVLQSTAHQAEESAWRGAMEECF